MFIAASENTSLGSTRRTGRYPREEDRASALPSPAPRAARQPAAWQPWASARSSKEGFVSVLCCCMSLMRFIHSLRVWLVRVRIRKVENLRAFVGRSSNPFDTPHFTCSIETKQCTYIYTLCMYRCVCVCIYIYICIERERCMCICIPSIHTSTL